MHMNGGLVFFFPGFRGVPQIDVMLNKKRKSRTVQKSSLNVLGAVCSTCPFLVPQEQWLKSHRVVFEMVHWSSVCQLI